MIENFKISVIIPVYNEEIYIRECIDSILAQTYTNLQIIIVDDGSTDLTGVICDEYSNLDKRIYVIHKMNGGVSTARNVGLYYTSGDFISFIDADDFLEPFMYETLVQQAVEASADISCCGFFDERSLLTKVVDNGYVIINKREAILKCLSLDSCSLNTSLWNKLFSSSLKNYLYFNENIFMGEDMLVCCSAINASNTFVYTDKPCYHYRMNAFGAMHNFKAEHVSVIEAHECLLRLLAEYPDLCDYIRYRMKIISYSLLCTAFGCNYKEKSVIKKLQKESRPLIFHKAKSIKAYLKLIVLTFCYRSYRVSLFFKLLSRGEL